MSTTRSVTFDDRDHTDLNYQGFWFLTGTYNASRVGETGTLASTNDQSASVTFTFPQPAVGFSYYGIKRCCGGSYGICIDCDPNNPNFVTIDAVDTSDDGKNPPVVLFSTTFPTPGVHEVILRNQADSRFANGNSQLTVDRFVIQVPVDPPPPTPTTSQGNGGVTTTTSSSTSSSSTSTSSSSSSKNTSTGTSVTSLGTSSSSSAPSSTSTNSPDNSSGSGQVIDGSLAPPSNTGADNTSPSQSFLPSTSTESSQSGSKTPIGAIVGGVLGALALLLLAAIVYYWMRLRGARNASAHHYYAASDGTSGIQTTTATMHEIGSNDGLSSSTGMGASTGATADPTTPSSGWGRLVSRHPAHSSQRSWSTFSYFTGSGSAVTGTESESVFSQNTARREVDAGPLPTRAPDEMMDDEGTLPPDYSVVFSGRESGRLGRGTSSGGALSPVRKS